MTRAFLFSALLLSASYASVAAAQVSAFRDRPIAPRAYAPTRGRECRSRGAGADGVVAQTGVCDGPRRVAIAYGQDEARAARLNLGGRRSADQLRLAEPLEPWLAEITFPPRDDMLWPVPWGLFSRGIGMVRREEIRHRPHNGIDIVARAGAQVRAVNDALVIYADNGVSGYGNLLVLLHADATATFYGHLRAIYVAPGELVARGQTVAEVGNTGRPVVPHLHFEWRRDGDPLDPLARFVERPTSREVRPSGEDAEDDLPVPPNARQVTRVGEPDVPQEEEEESEG